MSGSGVPDGWQNPITVAVGERQTSVSPGELLPSRRDLWQTRLDRQLQLIQAGMVRWTPILVTLEGVIIDGHHAVRAAADFGMNVDVAVKNLSARSIGCRIQDLNIHLR